MKKTTALPRNDELQYPILLTDRHNTYIILKRYPDSKTGTVVHSTEYPSDVGAPIDFAISPDWHVYHGSVVLEN
jgi:hypothetical protein